MPALMRAEGAQEGGEDGRALPEAEALKAQIAAAVMQVQAEDGAEQLGRAFRPYGAGAAARRGRGARAFDACRAYIANFEAEE